MVVTAEFTVRGAEAADIPRIAALERACFPLPRQAGYIARHLPDFLVAGEDGAFCGCADYAAVLDEGYIGNVAVVPAHRRRGVGDALVAALCARARREGLALLTLEVREGNAAARRLYEKHGFSLVGIQKNHYEKPVENAIIMTNNLKMTEEA